MDADGFEERLREALATLADMAYEPPRETGETEYDVLYGTVPVMTTVEQNMRETFGDGITNAQVMACSLMAKATAGDLRAHAAVMRIMHGSTSDGAPE